LNWTQYAWVNYFRISSIITAIQNKEFNITYREIIPTTRLFRSVAVSRVNPILSVNFPDILFPIRGFNFCPPKNRWLKNRDRPKWCILVFVGLIGDIQVGIAVDNNSIFVVQDESDHHYKYYSRVTITYGAQIAE